MNNDKEIKRLADAVAGIATAITEIIEMKLKAAVGASNPGDHGPLQRTALPAEAEGWVGKKDVAKHFKISQRSVDNWMRKGLFPYVRIGRTVRFKLSEADEALSRWNKIQGRW